MSVTHGDRLIESLFELIKDYRTSDYNDGCQHRPRSTIGTVDGR